MTIDGYSLDDKRQPLLDLDKLGVDTKSKLTQEEHAKNNLPDLLARWKQRESKELKNERTAQSFVVPKAELAANGYDLSLNRYKQVVHEHVEHRSPKVLIKEIKQLEAEIQHGLEELEGLLK
jgi:type I restriction enzyme M protein